MEQAMSVTIDLPPELEERLRILAKETGEPIAALLQSSLKHGLEDLEDYHAAVAAMRLIESGEDEIISA
jgi:predicted DNA-binding protein